MVPYSIEDLRQIISPIALQYGVESVSLFGSYSKGSAGLRYMAVAERAVASFQQWLDETSL